MGVDDTGTRREQARRGTQRRLPAANLVGAQHLEARSTVRQTALPQLLEDANLFFAGGDDDLPQLPMGNPAILAVPIEPLPTLHTRARLERSLRIVDARVNHFAVAARDLAGDPVVSLEHHHTAVRAGQGRRGGQTDHPGAHHHHIRLVTHRGTVRSRSTKARRRIGE
jgi:hypothetical protein